MFSVANARRHSIYVVPPTPGELIAKLRAERGLTLREASERSESLSHVSIHNLENSPGRWDEIKFGTLEALARAYSVTFETIARIARGEDPGADPLGALRKLEVHPNWVAFPVHGAVQAGEEDGVPINDDIAYVPLEHLKRKGADPDTTCVFRVTGRCMISEEALSYERNITPGDYVAVDTAKAPQTGDIVIAWWEERETLIIKRYGLDEAGNILYPLAKSTGVIRATDSATIRIIGPVVWRGG